MPDEPRDRGARRRRSDERAGTLVLIGGACDPRGPALGAFLDLTGARDEGRIVGFTTASSRPLESARAWSQDFALAGARNVELPIVDRRDRAQDPRIAEMVREARGIFLGGGDQVKLVSTIAGSLLGHAIRDAFAAGAVVCGTSAGAAALSETILAGGELGLDGTPVPLHLGPGLGLLRFSSLVDTHFSKRGRLQRLFRRVAENPELLGLGIDEDTAFVVRGHLGEVVGTGAVTYVDGRDVRFDNAREALADGTPLTLSHLRVGLIGARYVFNLRERELEVLVRAEREELPTVKSAGAA
ncbi:MAG TPA: cyanophycinase [Gemmatimonadaceae bacterium]|nr:cyanophycinase [Gemmatimonadaceae bacterium]